MPRASAIVLALITALAVCAQPADAAGADPHAKKAAVDPHAAKKAAAVEAPAPEKGGPAGDHAPKKAAAPDAHASKKPAAEAHAPAKDGAVPSDARAEKAPADGERLPIATDLHALNDRIQARLAEVRKAQAAKSPSGARASGGRHPSSAAPGAESRPRVELVWRPSVTWPEELHASQTGATQTPLPAGRVSVAWGPQP